jgi:hypothetical protein
MTEQEIEYMMKERKQWFVDRIGKRVYRSSVNCQCDSCKNGRINGIMILDYVHAIYLHLVEGEMGIRYTDDKHEEFTQPVG